MSQLGNEDRYFLEREAQVREQWRTQMEQKARAAAQQQAIAQRVGGNEPLARRLHELGFDADTTPALHLLPLVAVAWVDGQVTVREREAVLQVAQAHGIQPGSKPALLLTSMLEKRPSEPLLNEVLSLLHALLASRGLHPHSLVEACLDVASASGGFMGLGNKVSDQERRLIESIAGMFNAQTSERIVQKLE